MTISLSNVGSGFKRTAINSNFDTIESEINNNVLTKDGGTQLEADLDMNSNKLINLADGLLASDAVNLAQLQGAISAAGSGLIASQTETQKGSSAVSRVFTFAGITYTVGGNNLFVFQNGQKLTKGRDYTETTSSTITLDASRPLNNDDDFDFITNLATTNTTADTSGITHSEDSTNYNLASYLRNRHKFNVKDFGATGDGITDDTTAIQNALNAIDAVSGGELYVPAGIYITSSPLTYDGDNLVIKGEAGSGFSSQRTLIKNITTHILTLGSATVTTQRGAMIENVAFQGTGQTFTAIQVYRSNHTRIENCGFSFHDKAIEYFSSGDGCIIPAVTLCTFRQCNTAITDDVSGGGINTSLQVYGGYISGGLIAGSVGIDYAETAMIMNMAFDGCITGVNLNGDGSHVIGCRFELNTVGVKLSSQDRQRVVGNFFGHDFGTTPSTIGVSVESTSGSYHVIKGNTFQGYVDDVVIDGSYPSTNTIEYEDHASYTKILRESGVNNTHTLQNNFTNFNNDSQYTAAANAGAIAGYMRAHFDSTASDSGLEIGTSTAHDVIVKSNDVEALRVDDSATAGQTRLLVYDVDNGQVERVTVGAADSGGAGFKVLRIPN
jgi:hypothetical protein